MILFLVGHTLSVRRRIVTLTVLAAVLAITLFGVPLALAVAKFHESMSTHDLERAADNVALEVTGDLANGRIPELRPTPAGEEGEDRIRDIAIGVYSPTGRLIAGEGPPHADDFVRSARDTDRANGIAGDEVVLAEPVVSGASVVGVIRAAHPRSELDDMIRVTWLKMAGLGGIAIGASWLIGLRISARLARPLEDLAVTAERLGEGDFTVRARRTGVREIDQVAEALDVTSERIGETLERERTFSSDASHQLRTPLTGLRLQLEAALESPGSDPYATIRDGIASADRLERTIDDLLALAKQTRAPRSLLDLGKLFEEVRQTWHGLLAGRGRALRISGREALPARAADAAVRQVLAVLLDNAATHGTGTVTVLARDAGDALAIDVSDEGAIAGGSDPFVTREATEEREGNGIGLRLARSLAEAEGGRLRLTSPSPTTFTLLLPAERPAPREEGPGLAS
ncbi:sensor histidine kinase [Amycolatopsis regifaucium]|uniref:histidine kinase n=1 Tax=Amycolatopsis regifaucium TaxID=546365 RepID=A0A154M6H3_9PSEU|nr:HAMP domain-containing sensor histidine kinase [Amycolatopsis regifaucium]KZB80030.1 histidine kinase [Amycolatopsis regifaucium]OKA09601.1 two-component sensor histidine kinase [Amycolatopsis regifaucium]SFH66180.1 Signal transduction histidine kinase [Amycolatopsis regifaucium]